MPPSRNAKGTIAFMMAVAVGQMWIIISPVYQPPWEPWPPVASFMANYAFPFLVNYCAILIGLTGLVVFWVWEGERAGYLVALVLAALETGFGVFATTFNALNQEWMGALAALTAVALPALMALRYSLRGFRAHGSEGV